MSFCKQLRIIAAIVVTTATLAYGQEPSVDLNVVKAVPLESAAGTDVAFDVTVTNGGPDAADSVALDDPVPTGTTFVSAVQNSGATFSCSQPGVGNSSGSVHCTVPNMPVGSANFTFVFHIDPTTTPGTFITNVGTVSSPTDPNEENNAGSATTQTPPPPSADMRVTKLGPSGANPNTDATYTIEVSNGGPGDATLVTLDDTIPGDMTVVSLTQGGGPFLSCSSGSNGTLTCTIASFPAGATTTLTVVGHIPPGTPEGTTYINFATVTSHFDPNSENDNATSLLCVQGNSCLAGVCNGNVPVVCSVADQCHLQGTCNTVTGICAPNPPKVDGASCTDGTACTGSDSCQAGVCTGTNPVVCTAADQCHDQGTCDAITGICAPNPPKVDGAPCTDGNGCTQSDSCQSGACTGTNPVVCTPADQCHDQGTCSTITGTCAPNPPKVDGSPCTDGNACTQSDSCQAGVCTGANAVVCPTADQCHEQSTCDTTAGTCAPNPAKVDGAPCTDGNACTQSDTCVAGVCQSGGALSCDDVDACTADSCDSVLGCVHTGSCDGGVADAPPAAAPDARPADPNPDAAPDAAGSDGGCSCRTAGGQGMGPLAWIALLGLFGVWRRRATRPNRRQP